MSDSPQSLFHSAEAVEAAFAGDGYIADRALAITVMLAAQLEKPILLEGEAGVGKTEVAKVVAACLDTPLIRLQCYEGLDASTTLYEWNYARQILHIRMAEKETESREALEQTIFGDDFLLERPLLKAIRHRGPRPAVLLIDEVDRADEEFEAFLLEILSDFQVTVPELTTFHALQHPVVVLTSNRSRELGDALKRRCLYLWIDYPTAAKEREIIERRLPGIHEDLAEQVSNVMQTLRRVDFYKRPGIAETLDWCRALMSLGVADLDAQTLRETAGCLLKYRDDIEQLGTLGPERILAGELVDAAAEPAR